MGSSGFRISMLETYDPSVSHNIGVNIYGGPRGSLAGSLPTWIAWWNEGFEYEMGSIVYFNVFNPVFGQEEMVINQSYTTVGIQDGGNLLDDGGSLSSDSGGFSKGGAGTGAAGMRNYFYYSPDTLFVKINEVQENRVVRWFELEKTAGVLIRKANQGEGLSQTEYSHRRQSDSNFDSKYWDYEYVDSGEGILTQDDFYRSYLGDEDSVNKRRKFGWYSFSELDAFGWDTGFKSYPVSTRGSTELEVTNEQVILNMSDVFMRTQSGSRIIACNAVITPNYVKSGKIIQRLSLHEEFSGVAEEDALGVIVNIKNGESGYFSGQDHDTDTLGRSHLTGYIKKSPQEYLALSPSEKTNWGIHPSMINDGDYNGNRQDASNNLIADEIILQPTDKITIGGNILRSPIKKSIEDFKNESEYSLLIKPEFYKAAESFTSTDGKAYLEGDTITSFTGDNLDTHTEEWQGLTNEERKKFEPEGELKDGNNNVIYYTTKELILGPSSSGSQDLRYDPDQKNTIVSADYPAYAIPKISTAGVASLGSGTNVIDEAKASLVNSQNPYKDKVLKGYRPAYDPRYGEASTSLNAFIGSLVNYINPTTTDSNIDSWEEDIIYRPGQVVRVASTAADDATQERDRLHKDVLWVCLRTNGDMAVEQWSPGKSYDAGHHVQIINSAYASVYVSLENGNLSSPDQNNNTSSWAKILTRDLAPTDSSWGKAKKITWSGSSYSVDSGSILVDENFCHSSMSIGAYPFQKHCKRKGISWVAAAQPKPPVGVDFKQNQDEYGNIVDEQGNLLYWRPYIPYLNSPNSAISDIWNSFQNSVFLSDIDATRPENTQFKLSGEDPRSGEFRKRVSDMTGGSRLYGHLTVSPGRKFSTRIFRKRNWAGRRKDVSFRYPPAYPSDTAQADLWLFPNNFRKDHAGQIKYAVHFGDHTQFFIAQKKLKSWWKSLIVPLLCIAAIAFTAGAALAFAGYTAPILSAFQASAAASAWAYAAPAVYAGLGALGGAGAAAIIPAPGSDTTAFSRNTFSTFTETLGSNFGFSASRSNPQDSVFSEKGFTGLDGDLNDDPLYDQIGDVIRYNFNSLYPYLLENKEGNVLHIDGSYSFIVQDLISGGMVKTSFSYQEIAERASRSEVDGFDKSFVPGQDGHGGCSAGLYDAYNRYANMAVKKDPDSRFVGDPDSTPDLKLLNTRNYFNYLVLGPDNVASEDPSKASLVWSMDLQEEEFNQICGIIQTGYRDIDFAELKTNKSGGLVDDKGEIKSFPLVLDYIGAGLDQEQSLVQRNAFSIGRTVNEMGQDFENKLNARADSEWKSDKTYEGGSAVRHESKLWFALRRTTQQPTENSTQWRRVGSLDLGVKLVDAPTGRLNFIEGLNRILRSPDAYEPVKSDFTGFTNPQLLSSASNLRFGDRGINSPESRKLDFSFVVKESVSSELLSWFFLGTTNSIQPFGNLNLPFYGEGMCVSINPTGFLQQGSELVYETRKYFQVANPLPSQLVYDSLQNKAVAAYARRGTEEIPANNDFRGVYPGLISDSFWAPVIDSRDRQELESFFGYSNEGYAYVNDEVYILRPNCYRQWQSQTVYEDKSLLAQDARDASRFISKASYDVLSDKLQSNFRKYFDRENAESASKIYFDPMIIQYQGSFYKVLNPKPDNLDETPEESLDFEKAQIEYNGVHYDLPEFICKEIYDQFSDYAKNLYEPAVFDKFNSLAKKTQFSSPILFPQVYNAAPKERVFDVPHYNFIDPNAIENGDFVKKWNMIWEFSDPLVDYKNAVNAALATGGFSSNYGTVLIDGELFGWNGTQLEVLYAADGESKLTVNDQDSSTLDNQDRLGYFDTTEIWLTSYPKQIGLGSDHTIVLGEDGSVWVMGRNLYGELGIGSDHDATVHGYVPRKIYDSGVKYVAAGYYQSFIIMDNGDLYACGRNNFGQLGIGNTNNSNTFEPVLFESSAPQKVTHVAVGQSHTAIITEDGSLYTAGRGSYGIQGRGVNNTSFDKFGAALDLSGYPDDKVVSVACGQSHTAYVRNNGTLWAFGQNNRGQIFSTDDWSQQHVPVKNPTNPLDTKLTGKSTVNNASQVVAGESFTVWLADGYLYGMGDNTYRQLIDFHTDFYRDQTVNVQMPDPALSDIDLNITHVAAGENHLIFADNVDDSASDWDYGVFGRGRNADNQYYAGFAGSTKGVFVASAGDLDQLVAAHNKSVIVRNYTTGGYGVIAIGSAQYNSLPGKGTASTVDLSGNVTHHKSYTNIKQYSLGLIPYSDPSNFTITAPPLLQDNTTQSGWSPTNSERVPQQFDGNSVDLEHDGTIDDADFLNTFWDTVPHFNHAPISWQDETPENRRKNGKYYSCYRHKKFEGCFWSEFAEKINDTAVRAGQGIFMSRKFDTSEYVSGEYSTSNEADELSQLQFQNINETIITGDDLSKSKKNIPIFIALKDIEYKLTENPNHFFNENNVHCMPTYSALPGSYVNKIYFDSDPNTGRIAFLLRNSVTLSQNLFGLIRSDGSINYPDLLVDINSINYEKDYEFVQDFGVAIDETILNKEQFEEEINKFNDFAEKWSIVFSGFTPSSWFAFTQAKPEYNWSPAPFSFAKYFPLFPEGVEFDRIESRLVRKNSPYWNCLDAFGGANEVSAAMSANPKGMLQSVYSTSVDVFSYLLNQDYDGYDGADAPEKTFKEGLTPWDRNIRNIQSSNVIRSGGDCKIFSSYESSDVFKIYGRIEDSMILKETDVGGKDIGTWPINDTVSGTYLRSGSPDPESGEKENAIISKFIETITAAGLDLQDQKVLVEEVLRTDNPDDVFNTIPSEITFTRGNETIGNLAGRLPEVTLGIGKANSSHPDFSFIDEPPPSTAPDDPIRNGLMGLGFETEWLGGSTWRISYISDSDPNSMKNTNLRIRIWDYLPPETQGLVNNQPVKGFDSDTLGYTEIIGMPGDYQTVDISSLGELLMYTFEHTFSGASALVLGYYAAGSNNTNELWDREDLNPAGRARGSLVFNDTGLSGQVNLPSKSSADFDFNKTLCVHAGIDIPIYLKGIIYKNGVPTRPSPGTGDDDLGLSGILAARYGTKDNSTHSIVGSTGVRPPVFLSANQDTDDDNAQIKDQTGDLIDWESSVEQEGFNLPIDLDDLKRGDIAADNILSTFLQQISQVRDFPENFFKEETINDVKNFKFSHAYNIVFPNNILPPSTKTISVLIGASPTDSSGTVKYNDMHYIKKFMNSYISPGVPIAGESGTDYFPGTVTKASGSLEIVGYGTKFTNLRNNDIIQFENEAVDDYEFFVNSVEDDEHLTLQEKAYYLTTAYNSDDAGTIEAKGVAFKRFVSATSLSFDKSKYFVGAKRSAILPFYLTAGNLAQDNEITDDNIYLADNNVFRGAPTNVSVTSEDFLGNSIIASGYRDIPRNVSKDVTDPLLLGEAPSIGAEVTLGVHLNYYPYQALDSSGWQVYLGDQNMNSDATDLTSAHSGEQGMFANTRTNEDVLKRLEGQILSGFAENFILGQDKTYELREYDGSGPVAFTGPGWISSSAGLVNPTGIQQGNRNISIASSTNTNGALVNYSGLMYAEDIDLNTRGTFTTVSSELFATLPFTQGYSYASPWLSYGNVLELLDFNLNTTSKNIVPEYSENITYEYGDVVRYNGNYYQANYWRQVRLKLNDGNYIDSAGLFPLEEGDGEINRICFGSVTYSSNLLSSDNSRLVFNDDDQTCEVDGADHVGGLSYNQIKINGNIFKLENAEAITKEATKTVNITSARSSYTELGNEPEESTVGITAVQSFADGIVDPFVNLEPNVVFEFAQAGQFLVKVDGQQLTGANATINVNNLQNIVFSYPVGHPVDFYIDSEFKEKIPSTATGNDNESVISLRGIFEGDDFTAYYKCRNHPEMYGRVIVTNIINDMGVGYSISNQNTTFYTDSSNEIQAISNPLDPDFNDQTLNYFTQDKITFTQEFSMELLKLSITDGGNSFEDVVFNPVATSEDVSGTHHSLFHKFENDGVYQLRSQNIPELYYVWIIVASREEGVDTTQTGFFFTIDDDEKQNPTINLNEGDSLSLNWSDTSEDLGLIIQDSAADTGDNLFLELQTNENRTINFPNAGEYIYESYVENSGDNNNVREHVGGIINVNFNFNRTEPKQNYVGTELFNLLNPVVLRSSTDLLTAEKTQKPDPADATKVIGKSKVYLSDRFEGQAPTTDNFQHSFYSNLALANRSVDYDFKTIVGTGDLNQFDITGDGSSAQTNTWANSPGAASGGITLYEGQYIKFAKTDNSVEVWRLNSEIDPPNLNAPYDSLDNPTSEAYWDGPFDNLPNPVPLEGVANETELVIEALYHRVLGRLPGISVVSSSTGAIRSLTEGTPFLGKSIWDIIENMIEGATHQEYQNIADGADDDMAEDPRLVNSTYWQQIDAAGAHNIYYAGANYLGVVEDYQSGSYTHRYRRRGRVFGRRWSSTIYNAWSVAGNSSFSMAYAKDRPSFTMETTLDISDRLGGAIQAQFVDKTFNNISESGLSLIIDEMSVLGDQIAFSVNQRLSPTKNNWTIGQSAGNLVDGLSSINVDSVEVVVCGQPCYLPASVGNFYSLENVYNTIEGQFDSRIIDNFIVRKLDSSLLVDYDKFEDGPNVFIVTDGVDNMGREGTYSVFHRYYTDNSAQIIAPALDVVKNGIRCFDFTEDIDTFSNESWSTIRRAVIPNQKVNSVTDDRNIGLGDNHWNVPPRPKYHDIINQPFESKLFKNNGDYYDFWKTKTLGQRFRRIMRDGVLDEGEEKVLGGILIKVRMLKPQIWDAEVQYYSGDVVNYASSLYIAEENSLGDAVSTSSNWSTLGSSRNLESELRHNIDQNIFWDRVDASIANETFTVDLDPVQGVIAWTRKGDPGEWV